MNTLTIAFSVLVLDFDGVILESTGIKTEAFVEMFADYPEHHDAILRYHQRHLGMSRYKKFTWIYHNLLRKPISQKALKKLGTRFSDITFKKIIQAPMVPGALQTLRACAWLDVPTFIISGTPHEELQKILKQRSLTPYITEAWGSPNEKAATIQKISAKYGINTSDMLFIGDAFFDYQVASSQGVPFIARETGEDGVNWSRLGIPSMPDLTSLAALGSQKSVTIDAAGYDAPQVTLTLQPMAGARIR